MHSPVQRPFLIALAALLAVALPAHAEDGCGSCDGGSHNDPGGDVNRTGPPGPTGLVNETGASDEEEPNDGGPLRSLFFGAVAMAAHGPCELVIYDTSSPTSTRIDPDGCVPDITDASLMLFP